MELEIFIVFTVYLSELFGFCCFGVLALQYVEVRNVCLLACNRTEISEDDSDYYSYKHYLCKRIQSRIALPLLSFG